jgi:thiamine-phosphate pyrophosphorylase
LRLLDANANRAREALRVMEDYARFVLDSEEISLALKTLRHQLAEALTSVLQEAILHRDTPGDVGKENKTTGELTRGGVADVVTAAGKRLGEALRALEEFGKIGDRGAAAKIERVRYAAYDLELRLARTLRPADKFRGVRLYVLLTESVCHGDWLTTARAALAGGADCIQLREKTLEAAEWLQRAKALADECHRAGALFIVNDRVDIALASGADGVHVGQTDLPALEARKLVGPELIVGVSTHNVAQARQAVLDGADYVGIGPVFPSKTKPRDFLPGLPAAKEVAGAIKIPAIAIAGIDGGNVDDVLATGVSGVAVSSAVIGCADVKNAARELKGRIEAFAAKSRMDQKLSPGSGRGS